MFHKMQGRESCAGVAKRPGCTLTNPTGPSTDFDVVLPCIVIRRQELAPVSRQRAGQGPG